MGDVISLLGEAKDVVANAKAKRCEIRRVLLASDPEVVRTVVVARSGVEQEVQVIKMSAEKHGGRLPARCIADGTGHVQLLFYVMPGSSNGMIGDQNLYGFVLQDVDVSEVVSYPADLPVFIDQCVDDGRVHYVFLFTEQNWNEVIIREKNDAVL